MPHFPLSFRSGLRSALFVSALLSSAIAQADWNVSVGSASSNGAWSNTNPDVWTPSATGATVAAAEINTRLNAGTAVEIKAVAGSGAEAGNIVISQPITSSHASANLTLTPGAGGDYMVKSPVTLSGASPALTIAGAAYTVVNSAAALQNMNSGLSTNYALGSDIDASSIANFSPVGDNATKFTGKFAGLGHTITGLTITRLATDYVGLFGYATGTLRDVGLLNCNVSGQFVTGMLAGRSNGPVSYSYADGGSVTGDKSIAGGLIGQVGGSLDYSYANVSVTGNSNGISSTAIGGLAGSVPGGGAVSNSYATGSVSGGTDVGGLVGQIGIGGATVTNGYSTGAVTWTISGGGLIGSNSGTVSNSYWNKATSGKNTSAAGTGVDTTASMQTQSTFTGFDFTNTWRIYAGHTYPLLKHFLTSLTVTADDFRLTYTGTAYTGALRNPTYSVSGAASSGHLFNLANPYNSVSAAGSYTPDLYSDQRGGYDIAYSGGTLSIVTPDPEPPHVYTSAGVEAILTDTTPVTAVSGSILVIPAGTNVAGVAITLAAPSGGGEAGPITFKIGGLTLALSGYSSGTVVTFKKVMVNGAETLVLAVSSGSLSLSGTAGQPLLTLNGSATLTAGTDGTAMSFSAGNDGSGSIAVGKGYIVLSANAFAQVGTGNDFAALKDGKLYAGEVASFNSAGKISGARLGSLDGQAGQAGQLGDSLGPLSSSDLTAKVKLQGKPARLGGTLEFADALAAALGQGFSSAGQNGDGVLRVNYPGGSVNALPLGQLAIDTDRSDGVTLRSDGLAEVAVSGIVATFAPALPSLRDFIADLPQGATVVPSKEGVLAVSYPGTRYWVRPAWLATSGGAAGLSRAQAIMRFGDGKDSYPLNPAFAGYAVLCAKTTLEIPGATCRANLDGSVALTTTSGQGYTLTARLEQGAPGADALTRLMSGQRWWQEADGRLFLNAGAVQEFDVK
ncbi:MAG: hypothetical protein KGZ83_13585 [Sulfuricella sp.]|nr:hypothetical protein [Sulfuricella sp.]